MKFNVKRHNVTITPESGLDEAYIEEVLKLRKDGDTCLLVRKNTLGLSYMTYLTTKELTWKPETIAQALEHSTTTSPNAELAETAAKICFEQLTGIIQTSYTTKGQILSGMQSCIIDGAYEKLLALTALMIRSYENDKEA